MLRVELEALAAQNFDLTLTGFDEVELAEVLAKVAGNSVVLGLRCWQYPRTTVAIRCSSGCMAGSGGLPRWHVISR